MDPKNKTRTLANYTVQKNNTYFFKVICNAAISSSLQRKTSKMKRKQSGEIGWKLREPAIADLVVSAKIWRIRQLRLN